MKSEIDEYFFHIKYNSFKSLVKVIFQYITIFKHITIRPKECNLNVRIIDAAKAPKAIDSLWKRVKNGYFKIVVRDYSYIRWKYGNCPLRQYQIIIIEKR